MQYCIPLNSNEYLSKMFFPRSLSLELYKLHCIYCMCTELLIFKYKTHFPVQCFSIFQTLYLYSISVTCPPYLKSMYLKPKKYIRQNSTNGKDLVLLVVRLTWWRTFLSGLSSQLRYTRITDAPSINRRNWLTS